MSWKITVKKETSAGPFLTWVGYPVATRPCHDWPGQVVLSAPPKGSLFGTVLCSLFPLTHLHLRGSLLCVSCVLALSYLGSGVVESGDMRYGLLLLSVLLSSFWLFPVHLACFLVSVQDPHC